MSVNLINEILNRLEANKRVLFVWSGKQVPAEFQSTIEKLQEKLQEKVQVEHSERLRLSNHEKSSFDAIVSNPLTIGVEDESKFLADYLRLLKPKGLLISFTNSSANLLSELKLNGYLNANESRLDSGVVVLTAEKPNFEVGSASRLKFAAKKDESKAQEAKPKVWQFSPSDIQEDDLINTDDLLDEADLKKPVLLDKFDCGESKAG